MLSANNMSSKVSDKEEKQHRTQPLPCILGVNRGQVVQNLASIMESVQNESLSTHHKTEQRKEHST